MATTTNLVKLSDGREIDTKAIKPNWQEYMQNGAIRCPFCQYEALCGDSWNCELGSVSQRVTCNECGETWTDTYQQDGVSIDDDPENEINGEWVEIVKP